LKRVKVFAELEEQRRLLEDQRCLIEAQQKQIQELLRRIQMQGRLTAFIQAELDTLERSLRPTAEQYGNGQVRSLVSTKRSGTNAYNLSPPRRTTGAGDLSSGGIMLGQHGKGPRG
jgi:hypothetical protein